MICFFEGCVGGHGRGEFGGTVQSRELESEAFHYLFLFLLIFVDMGGEGGLVGINLTHGWKKLKILKLIGSYL